MTDGSAPLDRIEQTDVHGHAGPGGLDDASQASPDHEPSHSHRKRDKVRAAWISFLGRILAQLIGAAATILLGLYVVRSYGVGEVSRLGSDVPPAAHADRPPIPHDHRSIVVLPMVSFSPEQPDEALCAGITEAVIAQLAQQRGLRVVSRTSSMAYRGSNKTLPVIAAELGVDLVLEGSVTRVGERIRVTTQLVDASTDTHLWAATYDRSTADLLTLESELAARIADGIRAALEEAPR